MQIKTPSDQNKPKQDKTGSVLSLAAFVICAQLFSIQTAHAEFKWPTLSKLHDKISKKSKVEKSANSKPGKSAKPDLEKSASVRLPQFTANQIQFIETEEQAFDVRLQMIRDIEGQRARKKEILAQYFEVGDDDLSVSLLAYLKHVAQEDGVVVKLIIDGMFNRLSPATIEALMANTEGRFQIRFYNQIKIGNFKYLTARIHDKTFIAGGDAVLLGSRNVAETYFGEGGDDGYFKRSVDAEVVVTGEVARQARKYFLEMWDSKEVSPPVYQAMGRKRWKDQCDNRGCPYMGISVFDPLNVRHNQVEQLLNQIYQRRRMERLESHSAKAFFVANRTDLRVSKKQHQMADQLFQVFSQKTKSRLDIVSPYVYPSEENFTWLRALRKRDVKIRLFTNSRSSTSTYLAQAGYEKIRSRLVELGIEIYEYKGPQLLHSKLFRSDGAIYIGSYNLDIRSQYINREVGVVVDARSAPGFSSDMDHLIESYRKRSWLVASKGRPAKLQDDYKKMLKRFTAQMSLAAIQLMLPGTKGQL